MRLRHVRIRELSLEDRNILYFTLDTALQGLVMGGIFNFISVFVVRLQASKLMVSLVTSLPAIVVALFSIPAGQFVQRQRNLVRLTNFVRIFHRGSFLLIALLPFFVRDYLAEVIIVIWALKSIAAALLEASWMAVVAEMIPPERRAQVNGMRWMILSIVTAVAVAVFGYILDSLPFPLSYQIVFFTSFTGGVIGMVFFGKLRVPDNVPVAPTAKTRISLKQQIRTYLRTMNVPDFVRYELTASVLRFGLNLPTALYSIYWIRILNASDLWIGWQSTANQVALIVGYYAWSRIIRRKGYRSVLLVCTVFLGFYPILTALVTHQTWLPVVAFVQGLFITGVNLAFFDTLLAVAPAERRPSFVALNTLLASFVIFLAPMTGSALAGWLDIRGVFYLAGAIHFVAALLFWKLKVAAPTQSRHG